jgi:site-specific DNA-methyltransferase (adenine-specific)
MRDAISVGRIKQLHPSVKDEVARLIDVVESGLPLTAKIRIVQGLRTISDQNALFALGRTKPGQIVTSRKPTKKELFEPRQKSFSVIPEVPLATSVNKANQFINHLYFGDCLEVMQKLSEQSEPFIDLIYIDPPFNSKRNYNVLFESIDLKDSTAQKQAFADTWSNVTYVIELGNLAHLNKDVYDFLNFLDKSKSVNDSAVAYLTTMALRIWYMHKLLKETGSFYLHCDPTMSHYLKLVCDMIFGQQNYRNEIIWNRSTNAKGSQFDAKKFGVGTDTIFYYAKSNKTKFYLERLHIPLSEEQIKDKYDRKDLIGVFTDAPIICSPSMGARPNLVYTYKGFTPPPEGWRVNKNKLIEIDEQGNLGWTKNGLPYRKLRPESDPGTIISNLWTDISPINPQAKEKLGYPTQKPESLLERIIKASSNEGDVVADFFCGCGTTIAAAQKLNRKWLGADISHLAIKLILQRLQNAYGDSITENVKLHGFPKDIDSAKMLARETENGRRGFQEWVIEVLLHGIDNPKKTADGGYDGYLTYNTEKGKEFVLIEVKSGNVNVKNMREFIQVVTKQNAAAGIFVCFEETVTREMLKEAKHAGTILIDGVQINIDKIQILTIDDMLIEGKQPHLPNVASTFKQAERVNPKNNQLAIKF